MPLSSELEEVLAQLGRDSLDQLQLDAVSEQWRDRLQHASVEDLEKWLTDLSASFTRTTRRIVAIAACAGATREALREKRGELRLVS